MGEGRQRKQARLPDANSIMTSHGGEERECGEAGGLKWLDGGEALQRSSGPVAVGSSCDALSLCAWISLRTGLHTAPVRTRFVREPKA